MSAPDSRRTAAARRDAALAQARALDAFTVEDLMRMAELPQPTARSYIKQWLEAGAVVMIRKDGRVRHYIAAEKRFDGITPPETGQTAEGNMWRAMRQLRQFSPLDVATLANAGGVEVSIEKARTYCRRLLGAGYLRVLDRAVPGRREAFYQLIRNTGPKAPVPQRITVLHDPNTGANLARGEVAT